MINNIRSIDNPISTVLKSKDWIERFAFITKEKIEELIKYKDKEEINAHDFELYLREAWLKETEIRLFFDYYLRDNNVTGQVIWIKKMMREYFKIINNKSLEKQNIIETENYIEQTKDSLSIEKKMAEIEIDINENEQDEVFKLAGLNILWQKTSSDEVQKLFENAMIKPSISLIKSIHNEKNPMIAFETLYDWLENVYWDAEMIISKAIIIVLKNMKNAKKHLEKLIDCHEIIASDNVKYMYEQAMIEPTIKIIERSEKMNNAEALEELKEAVYLAQWQAEILIIDEITYLENLHSISSILLS